ncbi:MAG: response regulator [Chloroflexi bacterium]|nr:response regulator [Chloroflexota bacterium]
MIEEPVEVLLVEDNPNDVELTIRALKRCSFIHHIHVARDGVEALDFVFCTGIHAQRTRTNQPHVILLDLKLPRMDGWTVLERLKADPNTQAIPVVILTSSSDPNDVTRCYQLGANSYIVKPVDFAEFTRVAQLLGTYWMTLNHTLNT